MGPIRVLQIDLHILNMRTRMPFKYGIATLTALPHLLVRVELECGQKRGVGIASDGLPPKWFTKDPDSAFADELADMFAVINSAATIAQECAPTQSVFQWWQRVYARQQDWAKDKPYPPLLWGLGVSLLERAVIDAFCRANGLSFCQAVHSGALGMELGAIHESLTSCTPRDFLPSKPARSIIARHTVGLADPLSDGDIPSDERLDDGLPHSLEAAIRVYGITHLKIKACGDVDRDVARFSEIAKLTAGMDQPAFTLDGNEQFADTDSLKNWWRELTGRPELKPFLGGLLFLEQPLHRNVALSEEAGRTLTQWTDRPPIIIDESDGELTSLPTALKRGYIGSSFKSCKGVFKGIANACLIEQHRRAHPQQTFEFSGEDLANVGPIALLQDLVVAATLGIKHLERNGHHYFRGLSMWPQEVQQQVLADHSDLYRQHERGFATLDIKRGTIAIGSVVDGPFGPIFDLDSRRYTPIEQWDAKSLD